MERSTLSLMTFLHSCPQHCSSPTSHLTLTAIHHTSCTVSVQSFNQSELCKYVILIRFSCSQFLIIHADSSPSLPSSLLQSSLEFNVLCTAIMFLLQCVYAILYVPIQNIYCVPVYALFSTRIVTPIRMCSEEIKSSCRVMSRPFGNMCMM